MTHKTSPLIARIRRATTPCRDHRWIEGIGRLLTEREETSPSLGDRWPLLLTLLLLANARSGRVLVSKLQLSEFLHVGANVINTWLSDLEKRELLRVEVRGYYLVLWIRLWSERTPAEPSEDPTGTTLQSQSDVRISSTALQSAKDQSGKTAEAELQAGGKRPREGEPHVEGGTDPKDESLDRFVDRLVRALGAQDERRAYRTFCARYSRPILEAALRRVEEIPENRIRRSRGALFTYLVKSFAREKKSS